MPAQLVQPEVRTPARKRPAECDDSPQFKRRLREKTSVEVTVSPAFRAKLCEAEKTCGLGGQGNPERKFFSHEALPLCSICAVPRHSSKWIYRLSGSGKRVTTGSICYCCWKASRDLNIPRGLAVLQMVPDVKLALKLKARALRHQLRVQQDDECTCFKCSN